MSPKLPHSMPWEIYQTYLSGPAALMRLFEEAFGQAALYGPPDPEQQQRSIDALSEDITRLRTQIERLQEEKRELSYRNSCAGTQNSKRNLRKTHTTLRARLRLIRHGLREPGVCADLRVEGQALKRVTVARPSGSGHIHRAS